MLPGRERPHNLDLISGLQLSLQSQSLMYIQAFDNEKKQCLAALLEQEKWNKSDMVRFHFCSD
jgi:hypothetical protein